MVIFLPFSVASALAGGLRGFFTVSCDHATAAVKRMQRMTTSNLRMRSPLDGESLHTIGQVTAQQRKRLLHRRPHQHVYAVGGRARDAAQAERTERAFVDRRG